MSKITRDAIFRFLYEDAPYLVNSAIHKGEEEIGWKVCIDDNCEPVLVKLLIPKEAYRTWYRNKKYEEHSKHRCSKAIVLGFYSYYTGKEVTKQYEKNDNRVYSMCNRSFRYCQNDWVLPEWSHTQSVLYYSRSTKVCDSGIHYFKTKESAYMWADLNVFANSIFCCRPRYNAYRMKTYI